MEWSRLREQVLEKIKPSDAETNQTRDFALRLMERVDQVIESNGIRGIAEVHGSVKHGTWLAGAKDLDVFIVVEEGDRDTLKQVMPPKPIPRMARKDILEYLASVEDCKVSRATKTT